MLGKLHILPRCAAVLFTEEGGGGGAGAEAEGKAATSGKTFMLWL